MQWRPRTVVMGAFWVHLSASGSKHISSFWKVSWVIPPAARRTKRAQISLVTDHLGEGNSFVGLSIRPICDSFAHVNLHFHLSRPWPAVTLETMAVASGALWRTTTRIKAVHFLNPPLSSIPESQTQQPTHGVNRNLQTRATSIFAQPLLYGVK